MAECASALNSIKFLEARWDCSFPPLSGLSGATVYALLKDGILQVRLFPSS